MVAYPPGLGQRPMDPALARILGTSCSAQSRSTGTRGGLTSPGAGTVGIRALPAAHGSLLTPRWSKRDSNRRSPREKNYALRDCSTSRPNPRLQRPSLPWKGACPPF
jgi:hypothetical protein